MKKRISVVTGANGFVGSHLVAYLAERGDEVRCIVRASSKLHWLEGIPMSLIPCGLDDVSALAEAFADADEVYHLAGTTKAKRYADYRYGNVQLTRNVLEACRLAGGVRHIILTSSLAASAPSAIDRPVDERTPSNPISLYGKSKLEAERMVRAEYADLPYSIIRPPVVYGPRDTEVLLFFKTVAAGLVSKIGWKDKQVSLIYVADLVRGMALAANAEAAGELYFLNSDTQPTWAELGRTAAGILGKRTLSLSVPHPVIYAAAALMGGLNAFSRKAPTLNWQKAKEITQAAWTCSREKAEGKLGYQPKVPYPEGFQTTLEWYKEKGWL